MTVATSSSQSSNEVRFEPRTHAQAVAIRSTAAEFCYSGRRFGGKSFIGCAKAWIYANEYPGARVAVCREERASMETTTLLTLRQEIVPPDFWAQHWRESRSALLLPNGSEIHVFGLDKPGRALGSRYGMVVVDQAEQITLEQFEIINSCAMQVGMPFHQTMLLFNPDSPEHWAYKRYRPDEGDGFRDDEKGQRFAEVVHVLPDDLTEYLDGLSLARFDRMAGVLHDRYRLGLWRHFHGAVFTTWHPAKRVVDAPASWAAWGGFPPPDWQRGRGIDFGFYPDPFVCSWWAKDPAREHWYRYREKCELSKLADVHALEILDAEEAELQTLRNCAKVMGRESDFRSLLAQYPITASYSDHDRGERELLERPERYGRSVWTDKAEKDILAGLQTLMNMLTDDPEAPQMYLVRGAPVVRDVELVRRQEPTCLEEEMGGLRWPKPRDANAITRSVQLPVPGKDHCIDAARYFHHSLAITPGVRVVG
jgi:hypothetical protein